jgi:hypothetical protein
MPVRVSAALASVGGAAAAFSRSKARFFDEGRGGAALGRAAADGVRSPRGLPLGIPRGRANF